MATAAKCCLKAGKRAFSLVMDLIGPIVTHLSFAPPLNSAASRQSSMVRPLSRMATAVLTSRH